MKLVRIVMPVLHEYTDEYGMYVRSCINDDFITLQLTPSASKLLNELGYHDESKISWALIRPLWDNGYAYTSDGNSIPTDSSDVKVEFEDAPPITGQEERKLKEFLKPTKSLSDEVDIQDDVLNSLRKWVDEELSQQRADEFVKSADDTEGAVRSIRRFARYPVLVDQFELSQGEPGYTVILNDKQVRCVDLRWSQNSDEFVITIDSNFQKSQSLKISNGLLRLWQYHDKSPTGVTHVRKLIEYLPAIVRLSERINDYEFKLTEWSIDQATTFNLSDEFIERISTELKLLASTGFESPREDCAGKIQSINDVGHSVVAEEQTGEHLPIETDTADIVELSPGDNVLFDLAELNGIQKATSVRKKDGSDKPPNETELPDEISVSITQWTEEPEQILAHLELLTEFDISVDSLLRSVRTFRELKYRVQDFSINEAGHPVYSFALPEEGGEWHCTHHLSPTNTDFNLEIMPHDKPNQTVQIADGKFVYWRMNPVRDRSLRQQRHDFIRSQNEYLRFVVNTFGSISWYSLDG